MLTVDELWLTHAARLRPSATVTLEDVKYEELLFKIEALLEKSKSELEPVTRASQASRQKERPDITRARAPLDVRHWTAARFQPR